jgi:hypothetical protein
VGFFLRCRTSCTPSDQSIQLTHVRVAVRVNVLIA